MKRILIAVLVLPLLITGISEAADGKVYINGYNNTTKPFAYTENGVAKGFDIDWINMLAQEAGIQVRHVPIVWSEGPNMIRRGEIDMIASSMTITVPRMIKVRFSNPYWNAGQAVFTRNNAGLTLAQIQKGQAQSLGSMRGSTGAGWIQDEVIAKNNLAPEVLHNYEDYEDVAQAVMSGEIQAGVIDSPIVKLVIGDRPMQVVGVADTNEQYGVAMRKNDVLLHRIINHGLYKLMNSPEWEALKLKYNLN